MARNRSETHHYDYWMIGFPGTGEDIISSKLKKIKKDASDDFAEKSNAMGTNTTLDFYTPPQEIKEHHRIYIEFLQGVGTLALNPIYMEESGKIKSTISSVNNLMAATKGVISGSGEHQNIAYCMEKLTNAEKNNTLPKRIMLCGHSRGAAACIELARAIYLRFGETIKIALNLNDPVPGPGRHTESKKVIAPNVDSVIITYASKESSYLLFPLDIENLYFDPEKTIVTTLSLPIDHRFDSNDIGELLYARELIKEINTHYWYAIVEKDQFFYDLISQSDDDKGSIPNPEQIYLKSTKEGLEYQVRLEEDKIIHNKITWDLLPKNFPHSVPDLIGMRDTYLPDFIKLTSELGHTKYTLLKPFSISRLHTINELTTGGRKTCSFNLASDVPQSDAPLALKQFHSLLQTSLYGMGISEINGKHRQYVSLHTKNQLSTTEAERKELLNLLYTAGKTASLFDVFLRHYRSTKAIPDEIKFQLRSRIHTLFDEQSEAVLFEKLRLVFIETYVEAYLEDRTRNFLHWKGKGSYLHAIEQLIVDYEKNLSAIHQSSLLLIKGADLESSHSSTREKAILGSIHTFNDESFRYLIQKLYQTAKEAIQHHSKKAEDTFVNAYKVLQRIDENQGTSKAKKYWNTLVNQEENAFFKEHFLINDQYIYPEPTAKKLSENQARKQFKNLEKRQFPGLR